MNKFQEKFKKIIALNILILIIFGMFCIGMFLPLVGVQAGEMTGSDHRCGFVSYNFNLDNQSASCCLSRPYQSQAIIINNNFNDDADAPCLIMPSGIDLVLADIYYNNNFSLDIWPPPEIQILRSVMKRE